MRAAIRWSTTWPAAPWACLRPPTSGPVAARRRSRGPCQRVLAHGIAPDATVADDGGAVARGFRRASLVQWRVLMWRPCRLLGRDPDGAKRRARRRLRSTEVRVPDGARTSRWSPSPVGASPVPAQASVPRGGGSATGPHVPRLDAEAATRRRDKLGVAHREPCGPSGYESAADVSRETSAALHSLLPAMSTG